MRGSISYSPPRATAEIAVIPYRVGGLSPTAEQLSTVQAAVALLPAAIRARLAQHGTRIEVVCGHDCSIHPRARDCGIGLGEAHAVAVTSKLVVVSADTPGLQPLVLHELGHVCDSVVGRDRGVDRLSRSSQWQQIWEHRRCTGLAQYLDGDSLADPGEFFANVCKMVWGGLVPADTQREEYRFVQQL